MALQVLKYNKDTLRYEKEKKLLEQADKMYNYEKFKIGQHVKKAEFLNTFLLSQLYSNSNCDITNFINKEVKGDLETQTLESINRITSKNEVHNHYYSEGLSWEKTEW